MTSRISVVEEELLTSVKSRAAQMQSETQVGDAVLEIICDRFGDPRAVPLDDVKHLLVHALASYRHDASESARLAV